ncbi:MAG: TatD family hydrolase [Gracilimonas sp.]|uniref:TatD family hydrolase n=1 Tax=Gracilimonas sp. TaxID=1974203 RepID=UPI001B08E347|nr:TatD family hydrolase [Gracilimonas sp.]MBO6586931.1 TatD family hydrolase [Gracilimonas sp.]MBO6614581.1 TatD family hydrolase [Gracilimonas sp.]
MIDTHSHIYLPKFDEDRAEVNRRAAEAGVKAIFMPAIDFDSLGQMDKLSHSEIDFYKMAGIHPCDVESLPDDFEEQLLGLCSKEDIYGVGETGLDYYWSTDHVEEQKRSLRVHCKVAKEVQKPIIIHNRESTDDVLDILEEEQDGSLTGIWHCFNGTVEEGKRAIGFGFHLGIGGVVTFKNGGVDKTVAQLLLDKMVLETDAPYLSPTPKRGKRNEPAFMKYTAQKLADIFDLSLEEIDIKTTETAKRLFGI